MTDVEHGNFGSLTSKRGMRDLGELTAFISRALILWLAKRWSELNTFVKTWMTV